MISIWFIWSDTTLFVCQICHWIVKQKKENKEIYFKINVSQKSLDVENVSITFSNLTSVTR